MTAATQDWTHTYPREDAPAGRLLFEHGLAPRVELRGAPLGDQLARCRFEGDPPRIDVARGEITIDYRGFFRWFFMGRMAPGLIEINDAIPWAINVEGGVARTELDLTSVQLTRFEISGGAARIALRLGKPKGIVPIRIQGGAARVHLIQPRDVGARIKVGGGVAHLGFLEQTLGAVGGPVALESRRWDAAGDGYDIRIGGGAAHVVVSSEGME